MPLHLFQFLTGTLLVVGAILFGAVYAWAIWREERRT